MVNNNQFFIELLWSFVFKLSLFTHQITETRNIHAMLQLVIRDFSHHFDMIEFKQKFNRIVSTKMRV